MWAADPGEKTNRNGRTVSQIDRAAAARRRAAGGTAARPAFVARTASAAWRFKFGAALRRLNAAGARYPLRHRHSRPLRWFGREECANRARGQARPYGAALGTGGVEAAMARRSSVAATHRISARCSGGGTTLRLCPQAFCRPPCPAAVAARRGKRPWHGDKASLRIA
jgi:hypothetical protein